MNNEINALLCDYDNLIIGKCAVLDSYHFYEKSNDTKEQMALELIKYVNETYWRWTPAMLRDWLSVEIMKEWKIKQLLRYIRFPQDLHKEADMFYIAHLIYPDIIKINRQDIYLSVYRRVLSKDLKKYPKDYFSGNYAANKACACLKYAIENFHPFTSLEEMYRFFGTRKCLKFLREYKLAIGSKGLFDAHIEMLYLALPPSQQIPFLFQFYRFNQMFDENKRKKGERRGKKATHTYKRKYEVAEQNSGGKLS